MSNQLKYVHRDFTQWFNDLWDRVTDLITRIIKRFDHRRSSSGAHRARHTPLLDRLVGAAGWVWAALVAALTLLTLVVVL